ncbi:MAG: carbohydrate kinase family protein [Chloroflexi bacterium]|nr:carbohydrate kinase family protein [Chloroflexota bacterium]
MTRSEPTEIVVLGATCLDVKARPLAPVQPGTSNPAQIRLSPGGSGRNIAENLARLGVRASLLSVVGADLLGQRLLDRTAASGVDVSRVICSPTSSTGAYLALFTDENHQGYALDDVTQLKLATPDYILANRDLIEEARMVMVDGNADRETVAAVLSLAREQGVPVGLDPASVRRAYALRPHLSEFSLVTPNRAEAEALLDTSIDNTEDALEAARRMVALGVGTAIITLAEEGLAYATSEGHGRIPAIRCDVVDWTGAGDALAAAIVYGLLNQMPVDDGMRLGIAAATLTLSSQESVNPEMSLEQLYANMVI